MKSFWWLALPRISGRISRWLAQVLTDGYYLFVLPFGFLRYLSFIMLSVGLACGTYRVGYEFTPVEAPLLLYAFIFTGMLSGHLGFLLLLGFAIGDLLSTPFLFRNIPSNFNWELMLAKLHEYVIFGIAIVQIPIFTKRLIGLLITGIMAGKPSFLYEKVSQLLLLSITSLATIILNAYLCYLWSQARVLLLRTIYTHIGGLRSENISLFQFQWVYLIWTTIAGTMLRLVGQWSTLLIPKVSLQAIVYETQAQSFVNNAGIIDTLPKWVDALWNGLLITFLFWGAFLDKYDLALFLLLVTGLYVLRAYLIQLPFWPAWVMRIWALPPGVRLLTAGFISFLLVQKVLTTLYPTSNGSFWPVLVPTLLALLIFSFLIPVPLNKKNETA